MVINYFRLIELEPVFVAFAFPYLDVSIIQGVMIVVVDSLSAVSIPHLNFWDCIVPGLSKFQRLGFLFCTVYRAQLALGHPSPIIHIHPNCKKTMTLTRQQSPALWRYVSDFSSNLTLVMGAQSLLTKWRRLDDLFVESVGIPPVAGSLEAMDSVYIHLFVPFEQLSE